MATTYDRVKLHEALEILNAAAEEEGSNLQDMIGEGYESFKEFASTVGSNVQREVKGAYRAGSAKVREVACDVDEHVHTNAWAYIGGSAALGLLVGVLIARSRK